MTRDEAMNLGFGYLGEFIDVADAATGDNVASVGEIVLPQEVLSFVDTAGDAADTHLTLRTFSILLRNNQTFEVQGHALKLVKSFASQADEPSYGVMRIQDGKELCVALVNKSDVVGVFEKCATT